MACHIATWGAPLGQQARLQPTDPGHLTSLPAFAAPHSCEQEAAYLSNEECEKIWGRDKEEFKAMPAWKRINAKKTKGLF